MAVSRTPRDAAIATPPPWFVDKVDNSLTDLGRARSSTCRPSARRRRMLTESSSCHVSQRHSTSIDWSRFMAMMSSIFPAAERTFMQPNTSCCVIGDVCRGEVWTPMLSTGSVAHVCRRGAVEVFKMCNGLSRLKLNEFFTLADNTKGIRGHSRKLVKFRCTRDCCKYFFSNRVINRWNQLDQRVVDASSINAFKGWLNKIRETKMGFFMD